MGKAGEKMELGGEEEEESREGGGCGSSKITCGDLHNPIAGGMAFPWERGQTSQVYPGKTEVVVFGLDIHSETHRGFRQPWQPSENSPDHTGAQF